MAESPQQPRRAAHRGRRRLRATTVVPVAVGLACVALAIVLRFTEPAPPAAPGAPASTVTVSVPGPTTTISYLIEVTVTPGRNGF